MNRDDLDAFFAKAEDVLTDWRPDTDAMVARVDDEGAELPVADSYYEQPIGQWWQPLGTTESPGESWIAPVGASLAELSSHFRRRITEEHYRVRGQMLGATPDWIAMDDCDEWVRPELWAAANRDGTADRWATLTTITATELAELAPPSEPRARALWLRRNRNTGPASRTGLDGFRR